jgi:hypothetical protein
MMMNFLSTWSCVHVDEFNIIQSCCESCVFVSLIEIYAKCKVLPHIFVYLIYSSQTIQM